MDITRVARALKKLGAPAFRSEQVRRAVFKEMISSYDEIKVLPAALRAGLAKEVPLLSLTAKSVQVSKDGTRKAALELVDGRVIESVLLRPSLRRWTTCISSQVGCAVACTFCATGLMGFSRDLTPEEITDQVLFWLQYMKREGIDGRLSNVVYMGMGEPFACYESVSKSLNILMDQKLFGLGARKISVSTAGIAPKIEAFGKDFPQVNLALSLHAANDTLRTRLVPLNKAYPLARIAAALKKYLSVSSRKVFLEYVLLEGENDGDVHAKELLAFVKEVGPGEVLHVNLIVFNQTDTPHIPTSARGSGKFHGFLRRAGVNVTVRQNLGQDIQGACGQLIYNNAARKPK